MVGLLQRRGRKIINIRVLGVLLLTTFSQGFIVPRPQSQQHCHPSLLKQKPTFTSSSTTSLMPFTLHVTPVATPHKVIPKVDDISAIEALFPFLNHIFLTPYQIRKMIQFATDDVSQLGRIFLFATLGYAIPLIGQFSRTIIANSTLGTKFNIKQIYQDGDDVYKENSADRKEYHITKWYHFFNHVRQGCYLASINAAIDCCLDASKALGLDTQLAAIVSNASTSASFTIWAMYRMKLYRNIVFDHVIFKKNNDITVTSDNKKSSSRLKMIATCKEISDILLYAITAIIIMNSVGIKYSYVFKALSAFGGLGTLVFGLASKEVATQLVSRLVYTLQRPFSRGDKIMYGKKESIGIVQRVGLLYTVIRESDEVSVKVPNSELSANSVSNLSREKRSQVLQKLQFRYDTLDEMPTLVTEIKREIESSCPLLIKNGPFRVYFNSYQSGYLEVIVDARFRMQPYSETYYEVREDVMNAIGRAAKKCNCQFKF